uniref:acetyl-CoA carboxylase carboxyltransferase beta subunit n=1 Tax=Pellionia scabra TaxID=1002525 RepID=UPI001FA728B8|nr:acetyl-CoA carboxylase carboxyltransferase beta subunit [Pellionia scabra]ULF47663.1 acetyl-CoA carboxylase carboxyltransferase beta subunit [Pellionia scabra]
MEKWRFNSMFVSGVLEYRCGLRKSIKSLGDPIENTSVNEDPIIMDKDIPNEGKSHNSSDSNVDHLVGVRDIGNLISDDTFLVRDSNRDSYSIYFDIENEIFEIDNNHSFLSEPENSFYCYQNYSYLNNVSKNDDPRYGRYVYDTKYSWNNHVNSCIDNYLRYQICIDSFIFTSSENYNESSSSMDDNDLTLSESSSSTDDSDLPISESSNDLDETQKYKHLWVQCETCYGLNYKKFFKSKMNICEHCGWYVKMSSSDRIELLIDPGTWDPMDEDMVSLDPIEFDSEEEPSKDPIDSIECDSEEEPSKDPIEFDSEEEPSKDPIDSIECDSEEEDKPYKDRIDSYQRETGLTEAVQTGTGKLNGIPVAIGVMDFQFMGGSMGSVVGEKITRLIEYATNQFLPLILVCASGGARMQEGSLSLMQMAKISSALHDYQSNKKLFYVAILTSPTTGGVTASFGMLGDIIIAEPDAYIAFAGKRVIEQTLNIIVPEGVQVAEYLFDKGLFDPIVPRNPLKGVLSELFQFHAFFPLNENSSRNV